MWSDLSLLSYGIVIVKEFIITRKMCYKFMYIMFYADINTRTVLKLHNVFAVDARNALLSSVVAESECFVIVWYNGLMSAT